MLLSQPTFLECCGQCGSKGLQPLYLLIIHCSFQGAHSNINDSCGPTHSRSAADDEEHWCQAGDFQVWATQQWWVKACAVAGLQTESQVVNGQLLFEPCFRLLKVSKKTAI